MQVNSRLQESPKRACSKADNVLSHFGLALKKEDPLIYWLYVDLVLAAPSLPSGFWIIL